MPHTPSEIARQQASMRENEINQVAGSLRGQIDSLICRDYCGRPVEVRIPLARFKTKPDNVIAACKRLAPEFETKGWICLVRPDASDLLVEYRPDEAKKGDLAAGPVHFVFGLIKTGKSTFIIQWIQGAPLGIRGGYDDENFGIDDIIKGCREWIKTAGREVAIEVHGNAEAKLRRLFEAFPDAVCHFMEGLSPIARRIKDEGAGFLLAKETTETVDVASIWEYFTKRTAYDKLIRKAIAAFSPDPTNRAFNTAGIQSQLKIGSWMPSGDDVAAMLADDARVVRLKGGSHWLLLPDGVELHKEAEVR